MSVRFSWLSKGHNGFDRDPAENVSCDRQLGAVTIPDRLLPGSESVRPAIAVDPQQLFDPCTKQSPRGRT